MALPKSFCWTKFGTEAGQGASKIRERKEQERLLNDGIFLWGIGNGIEPSLKQLLRENAEPEAIFTPMLSAASGLDESPSNLSVWRHALDLDGSPYELPPYSVVTSRHSPGPRGRRHFALVCRSASPLDVDQEDLSLSKSLACNLVSANPVGSSQVTSVVQYNVDGQGGQEYKVAFRAHLVYPYLARLVDPLVVPGCEASAILSGCTRMEVLERLSGNATPLAPSDAQGLLFA